MTLREAREFLANKKVFVKNKNKEIQEKLFSLGFEWAGPREEGFYKDRYFLFLHDDLKITYINEIEYFYEHEFEEISVENILDIKVERLPKTWEDFCATTRLNIGNVIIYMYDNIRGRTNILDGNRCMYTNRSVAEQHLALMKLHQLRDSYREGSKFPYAISRNGSHLYISNNEDKFLSFQTKEIADEFLSNFSDLILQAGDLI